MFSWEYNDWNVSCFSLPFGKGSPFLFCLDMNKRQTPWQLQLGPELDPVTQSGASSE